MPFISAIVCSLISGALGGFIFSNISSPSFLTSFAIISACCLLATILFIAATSMSPATAQPAAAAAPGAKQGNNRKPAKNGAKGGRQNAVPNAAQNKAKSSGDKPKPRATGAKGKVEQGEVKRFFGNKGYGFICRENGEEIFVHFRSIEGDDSSERRYLKEGQKVEFTVVDTDRGPQAEDVKPL